MLLPIRLSYVCKVFLLLLIGAAGQASQSDSATGGLVHQVEEHYNSAKTLSVDFEESYSILGHRRAPETGTLTLRKVGKMRWDYRQPPGKLFITDGKTVYLFTASDNRVEKVSLKTTDDMRAPLAFLLGKLDMRKEFREISTRAAANGTWLVAQAKSDRLPYRSIEMLITGASQIERLIVSGRDESVTTYRFANEKVNLPVKDTLFHFQIPANAQVVDALESHSGEGQ